MHHDTMLFFLWFVVKSPGARVVSWLLIILPPNGLRPTRSEEQKAPKRSVEIPDTEETERLGQIRLHVGQKGQLQVRN